MRQNCHKKSFTFPFLLPCTTFQFDKGDQRQRQREDFQRHVKGKGQLSVDIRQVQEGSKSGIK